MIGDQYSVNIYFVVVFDIHPDVTSCSLLAAGFSAVPAVFLVFLYLFVAAKDISLVLQTIQNAIAVDICKAKP